MPEDPFLRQNPIYARHLLFVCDQYPPHDRGGYAQLCFDLADGLRMQGHTVSILTHQVPGQEQTQNGEAVYWQLLPPLDFNAKPPIPLQQLWWEQRRRQTNQRIFRDLLRHTKAQAVLFWPNLQLDRSLMQLAEKTPGLVTAYYLAGVSPTDPSPIDQYWQGTAQSTSARWLRRLLGGLVAQHEPNWRLNLAHVWCVSEYERQRAIASGVPAANTKLCRNGIDVNQFAWLGQPSERRPAGQPLRLLYSGRLVATKGAHLILDALASAPDLPCELTLLGAGDAAYQTQLQTQVAAAGLQQRVHFVAWLPRESVPAFMRDFDVLVLPTVHAEPLARVVQEAMAMGLNVVATDTGGTPEIVRTEQTGLLFDPNQPQTLTAALARLAQDRALADRLALAGRQLVQTDFNIETMFARVDQSFSQLIDSRAAMG